MSRDTVTCASHGGHLMLSKLLKEEAVIHWFKSESNCALVLGFWGQSKGSNTREVPSVAIVKAPNVLSERQRIMSMPLFHYAQKSV